ncbi:MAG TPA: ATP-binding protein, partial [Acidiferrobacteraceae bacterium]|nr:ATP-binding protein [Acidiferrobacteraceae bacterium]
TEVRLQLSLDEDPPLFLAIIQDLTERYAADERLAHQTAILRRQSELLHLAPALMRDLSDRITYWSHGVERLYGWREEDVLGRTSHELLATQFPQPLPDIMQELRHRGHWEGELTHRHRDGHRVTVMSYWALHRDTSGAPSAILELNNDITNLKRSQEQIRDLNATLEQRVQERTAQLEQVNQELEAFSYSVSHDLRGPLRGIDGFSQALLEDYGDSLNDEARHYLARMRQAAERMGQLIDALLKLARVTRAEMHHEQIDLAQLFHMIASDLRNQNPEHQAQFVAPARLPVQGDGALLRIVMENLLGNAWKFSARQPCSQIELGATQQALETVYFVRDNGVGFNMASADKLFGAFQRLHRASEFEGTGIGLVTVARIIHRHGGRVWAKSTPGQGATFYFTLRAPAEAVQARASR